MPFAPQITKPAAATASAQRRLSPAFKVKEVVLSLYILTKPKLLPFNLFAEGKLRYAGFKQACNIALA